MLKWAYYANGSFSAANGLFCGYQTVKSPAWPHHAPSTSHLRHVYHVRCPNTAVHQPKHLA